MNKKTKAHIEWLERKVRELRGLNFEYTTLAYENQQRCNELEEKIRRLENIDKPTETFHTRVMKPLNIHSYDTNDMSEYLKRRYKTELLEFISNNDKFFKIIENEEFIEFQIEIVKVKNK